MPKDGNEFLRYKVFGRLHLKEVGKDAYESNKLNFAKPCKDKPAYQEITASFVNALKEDWQDVQEEDLRKPKPQQDLLHHNDVPSSFNYSQFLADLPQMIPPSSARNEKNLRIIGELATIRGTDEITMRKLVSQDMDLKTSTLNVEQLKKKVRSCKSELHAEENKDSHHPPPVCLLQNPRYGVKVSRNDKYLIKALISDSKMKPEVTNVSTEYVLEMKNQQFPKAYVEEVVNTRVRLEVDTNKKVLAHARSETEEKEDRHKSAQKKKLPPWYYNQEEIKVDVENLDEDELLQKMKKLRSE